MNRRGFLKRAGVGSVGALLAFSPSGSLARGAFGAAAKRRDLPSILVHVADDLSWCHLGCAGETAVKTPTIDRMAAEGVQFTRAFVSSATCTASRAALLTGRNFWELVDGANLRGALPAKFEVYTSILARAGYHVGRAGKGYGPGTAAGWDHWQNDPAGPKASSLEEFLRGKAGDQPFVFWFGSYNPHRPYRAGTGARAGIPIDRIKLPPQLPDGPEVRRDVADYLGEVQAFDSELARTVRTLETAGQLDNTLVVVLGDNGMPFPRCKGDLYDYGTRVPLIIRWPRVVKAGRKVDDLVSYIDLAPTFLEAAGLKPHPRMTGRSILPLLAADGDGTIEPSRDAAFFGTEGLANGRLWPARGVRTARHLYLRNFEPERYQVLRSLNDSPTKTYMHDHRSDARIEPLWNLAFAKRPAEELYDIAKDPCQFANVAADPAYADVRKSLAARLEKRMRETGDPRLQGKQPGAG